MVYLLVCISLLSAVINYKFGKNDYFYPGFLFSFTFFFFSSICAIGSDHYEVYLLPETVFTIAIGLITFSIVCFLFHRKGSFQKGQLKYINISNAVLIFIIILQIISIIFFTKYLQNLTTAYASAGYTHLLSYSLSGMIKLYDTLTKFWQTIYSELAVPIPMLYRITNPVCSTAEYIALYVAINNLIFNKKIKISYLLIFLLSIIRIIMNGSRSPLFRMATFALMVFYVLEIRSGKIKRGSQVFGGKILIFLLVLFLIMFGALFVMGRATQRVDFLNEFFVYAGAPIANLNIFIKRYYYGILTGVSHDAWGAHVFGNLYRYAGKLFSFNVQITGFEKFEFSGGYEIGNVYTMFASILYDFGMVGIIPVVSLMAFYYGRNYYQITKCKRIKSFDYRLFIYAYLSNDIIMSSFSNRFYETILDAPFLKLLVLSWIIKCMFLNE